MKTYTYAAFALTALSACGGGGGGGSTAASFVEAPRFLSYTAGFDDIQDLAEDAANLGPSPAGALGATGDATYNGVLFLGARTVSTVVDAVVGEMDLTLDLASNTFDGSVTGFQGRGGDFSTSRTGSRDGEISITDGEIIRTDVGTVVVANVGGELDFGHDPEIIDVSGSLFGAFAGDNAELISGEVNVTYPIDPFTIGETVLTELGLEGGFAVERVD